MNELTVPQSLTLPLSSIIRLAVEWWRLSSSLPAAGGATRHALRKIEDVLREAELEVQSMDGRPFDAGLAVQVIDTVDDPTLPRGQAIIDQTVSPMVLWRGQVIQTAQVVTRKGTGKASNK